MFLNVNLLFSKFRFREKSGWIFERGSMLSRIKAGFSPNNDIFNVDEQLAPLKENIRQNLAVALDEFESAADDLNRPLQNAISTIEQVFTGN